MLRKQRHSKTEVSELRGLVNDDDLTYAMSVMQRFYNSATNYLKKFVPSQTRDMLFELAKFSIERDY